MLASVSKRFSRVFRSAAEQSKKYRDDTRLFVELRDFIVGDLMTKSQYMKEDDDDEYNDQTPDTYWTLFYDGKGGVVYLMRRTGGRFVSVFASNFKWKYFDVKTKAEWIQFSPLMARPGPFKLVENGESMIKIVLMARDEPVTYYYYYDGSGSELVTVVFDDDDDGGGAGGGD